MSSLQVSDKGALMDEPVRILDHRVRQLRRWMVDQVEVQWDNYSPHSTTWEDAYDMRQQFTFLFIDLWYCGTYEIVVHLFWHLYWETSGRILDQEGVYVTSRSGALTKLILWGHLLASDLDFYDDEPLNLDDDASWLMTGCFTIAIYRCYWLSFIECAGFRTLRMQRHRWNSLGLRIESGSGLFELFHLQWYCVVLMICYWFHDMLLTWSDMMVDDAGWR